MRGRRPSLTARVIARGVVVVGEDPLLRDLLPEGVIESSRKLLVEAGVLQPWRLALYRRRWYRRFTRWMVRRTASGQMVTLPIRKRFIEEQARRAIETGAGQLVVLGAGFDTLALRVAERFPEVQCFELDHPATQRVKRRAVESLGLRRPNLHFVSVDLASASLESVLEQATAWRKSVVTVAVAEGLLCYLAERDVTDLLSGVRETTPPGTTLLLTYMRLDAAGRIYAGKNAAFMRAALGVVGEPLQWAIRQHELASFLETRGFELFYSPSPDELRTLYLEPLGLGDEIVGDVELMAAARRR